MLDDFLEVIAARPFIDGSTDCVLTVADWVVLNGHPDPAAPWRGRYRTPLGRERLVRRHGGLAALMQAGAARAGLNPVADPVRGDVGLVRFDAIPMAAIRVGRLWAAQGPGLVVAPAETLMAWRV